MGHEVGHLEQAVGVGAAENGAGLLLNSLEPGSSLFQFIPALRPSRKTVEIVIQQLLSVQLLDGEVVEGVQHEDRGIEGEHQYVEHHPFVEFQEALNPVFPILEIFTYWTDRRLAGLAGPDYDATISFGLLLEPEDSQSRIAQVTFMLAT